MEDCSAVRETCNMDRSISSGATTVFYTSSLDTTRKRLFMDEEVGENSLLDHRVHSLQSQRSSRSIDGDDSVMSQCTTSSSKVDDKDEDAVIENTSPTSVVNIVMGSEGAEVALQDVTNVNDGLSSSSSLSMSANRHPGDRFSFRSVRSSSLLDVEKTPQRPQRPKDHWSLSASAASFDTPTSTGCGETFAGSSGQISVERTITCYLEDPTQVHFHSACTDWQFFFFGASGICPGASASSSSPLDPAVPAPSMENVRSVLRRRASHNLRARKRKVGQLRKDLAPFHSSPARSPAKAPSLFRNRSFSIADHRSAIVRVSKDCSTPRKSSFADVLQLCTMPEHTTLETPEMKRAGESLFLRENSEDLGYDSDPEDFTRRRHLSKRTAFSDEVGSKSEGTHDRGWSHNIWSHNNLVPSGVSLNQPSSDLDNDEMFATIVQEFFNQTSTLVFHPHSSILMESDITFCRPIAVEAWLERGQHLSDSLLQPKWMWKQKGATKNLQMQMADLQGVELLDVTRILKLEDITADEESCSILPFAKPSHCFVIKSIHDEELYFEAQSPKERDRLVYSLKLVIARFGAKVLVGDPAVYYEFFSMTDGVPGEAPELYQFLDRAQDGGGF